MTDRQFNPLQRVIITTKGVEIFAQIKDQMQRDEVPIVSTKMIKKDKALQEEYSQYLLTQPKASDQLQKYSSIVQNGLASPEEIYQYLEQKLRSSSTSLQAKFIERQLQKASMTIYKNSRKEDKVSKSLPFLDFRQTQYLKGKYKASLKSSGLCQLNVVGSQQQGGSMANSGTIFGSDPNNPPNTWETGTKRMTQMMFQESKLERMIHKYQDFKTKTGSLPRFDEVYRRNILQQPKFMKDLHKVEKETRVETLQELNARLMDKMSILNYETQIKTRQRQIMSELHTTKYVRSWGKRRFPGEQQTD